MEICTSQIIQNAHAVEILTSPLANLSVTDWAQVRILGGGGAWGPAPPPRTSHFEAQIFTAIATPLRDVGKFSAGLPPLTQILDWLLD